MKSLEIKKSPKKGILKIKKVIVMRAFKTLNATRTGPLKNQEDYQFKNYHDLLRTNHYFGGFLPQGDIRHPLALLGRNDFDHFMMQLQMCDQHFEFDDETRAEYYSQKISKIQVFEIF